MKAKTVEISKKIEKLFKNNDYPAVDCRNKRPATGWAVVGNCQFTNAIRMAGLPNDNFWSGSAPTPSTQAPSEIVAYCYKNFS